MADNEFVDVSNWQGHVDWVAVRGIGHQRGACKSSEGVGYADPQFRNNWAGLAAAGLKRIAYHFGRPDLGNSPEAEADWFWSVVSAAGFQPGDSLAEDIEIGSGNLLDWARRFLARLEMHAAGIVPASLLGLYSGNWFLIPHGITGFGPYYLWDSGYPRLPPVPPGWKSIDIHQFTSSASIPGIAGGVDCSRILNPAAFLGGDDDLPYSESQLIQIVQKATAGHYAFAEATYNGVKYGNTPDKGDGRDSVGQPAGEVAGVTLLKKLSGLDVQALAAAIAPLLPHLNQSDVASVAKAVVDEIGARVKPAV